MSTDIRRPQIAIQGIKASFHESAAKLYFGNDIDIVECNSFKTSCDMLANNGADYCVMAIENSIAGSILPNYNLIKDYGFQINAEVYMHIQMHLVGLKGVSIDSLEYVQSHPMAIRQCSDYLSNYPRVKILELFDTAACAKMIADQKLTNTAAISSKEAAEKYGLSILANNIENNAQNYTRFLVLSKAGSKIEDANKASLNFELKHAMGSLADVLIIFKNNRVNLTKIQSVPIIGQPYKYSFHADVEWENYADYQLALEQAKVNTINITVLGEYKKAHFNIHSSN